MSNQRVIENPDVILVGSGIMSANVGAMLKRLDPSLAIQVYEVTEELAQESSNGWNNAGTGHAGICELSYTPFRNPDGSVNVQKAIGVFEEFEYSLQFWGYAVASGMIDGARDFINPIPHISFVHGDEQVGFLKSRFEGMSAHHFFESMEYSTDEATIRGWAPLLTKDRAVFPIAATKMDSGTDVNFGAISRKLLEWLGGQDRCGVICSHKVTDLSESNGRWAVEVQNLLTGEVHSNTAKFVFIGAGGGSLRLLQKTGIPESKGLGGFPIGGQWLVCKNPAVVAEHQAKVYGQALDAAPTMAVPHLDTRMLDGQRKLLFGPFAAWTTKFLHKKGSWLDLPLSVNANNLATLIKIGISNLELVRYLVQQGTQSMADRMEVLRIFYPAARPEDWELIDAGIRVQAIKKTDGEAGIVHYGTEVITNQSKTVATLLGASPGASVSTHIALGVIETCLPDLVKTPEGQARLKEMLPIYGVDIKLPENAAFFREVHEQANQRLGLVAAQ